MMAKTSISKYLTTNNTYNNNNNNNNNNNKNNIKLLYIGCKAQ